MHELRGTRGLSLKSKLVLSYLLVILGTVLVLLFAVFLAVQNYLYNAQKERLIEVAQERANYIVYQYLRAAGSWSGGDIIRTFPGDVSLFVVVNQNDQLIVCNESDQAVRSSCDDPAVQSALQQTLQGKVPPVGSIMLSTRGDNFSSLYTSAPLKLPNGQTIGAILLAQPQYNASGAFLGQINQSILLAGFLVAAVAALCSFLFVRRFIRPLESLTMAAEEMKQGKYAQRVPIPGPQDEIGRLAQTFNEMADTIEADVNELRRQDQVRRDLIANIAHDLATPLTAIQGLSEAMADDVISDPEARQETAQRIGREVQRLQRLVADVRQMTMLEAGRVRLDLAPLDLHSLVDETLFVIEPECQQTGISVYNDIPTATPHVLADSDRITQVLLNLLDNARRNTPSGGSLRVHARVQDQSVLVTVSDTGVGIDRADLPHIFERFYRADRSRAAITGGSGLGLSIVKAIITAHRGTIWAESKPGVGTRITFRLPIAIPGREVSAQALPSPVASD